MINTAVIATANDFNTLTTSLGFRSLLKNGIRYTRISTPTDCLGWQFDNYTIPSGQGVNTNQCLEEVITRMKR